MTLSSLTSTAPSSYTPNPFPPKSTTTPSPTRTRPRPALNLNLHLNQPPATAPCTPSFPGPSKAPGKTMIAFDGLPAEIVESMCTPMHLILPPSPRPGCLYLGSLSASIDADLLASHRITLLVQVLDAPWVPPPPDSRIRAHKIDLLDVPTADLRTHLEGACDVIERALLNGENVLVHCQQGVSRSASIVIAYLIRKHHLTYDAAYALVLRARPCIKPNDGFVRVLREWEGSNPAPPMVTRRSQSYHPGSVSSVGNTSAGVVGGTAFATRPPQPPPTPASASPSTSPSQSQPRPSPSRNPTSPISTGAPIILSSPSSTTASLAAGLVRANSKGKSNGGGLARANSNGTRIAGMTRHNSLKRGGGGGGAAVGVVVQAAR